MGRQAARPAHRPVNAMPTAWGALAFGCGDAVDSIRKELEGERNSQVTSKSDRQKSGYLWKALVTFGRLQSAANDWGGDADQQDQDVAVPGAQSKVPDVPDWRGQSPGRTDTALTVGTKLL